MSSKDWSARAAAAAAVAAAAAKGLWSGGGGGGSTHAGYTQVTQLGQGWRMFLMYLHCCMRS